MKVKYTQEQFEQFEECERIVQSVKETCEHIKTDETITFERGEGEKAWFGFGEAVFYATAYNSGELKSKIMHLIQCHKHEAAAMGYDAVHVFTVFETDEPVRVVGARFLRPLQNTMIRVRLKAEYGRVIEWG